MSNQKAIAVIVLMTFGFFSSVGPYWHSHGVHSHQSHSHDNPTNDGEHSHRDSDLYGGVFVASVVHTAGAIQGQQSEPPKTGNCCGSEEGEARLSTSKDQDSDSRPVSTDRWTIPGCDLDCSICRFYASDVSNLGDFDWSTAQSSAPSFLNFDYERFCVPVISHEARGPPQFLIG